MQTRSTSTQHSPATYGLATQLRTPPQDLSSSTSFPSTTSSSSKKVTPAMRDEFKTSPTITSGWTARATSQSKRRDGERSKSQTKRVPAKSLTASTSERHASNWTPTRPRRPSSPTLHSLPPPLPSSTWINSREEKSPYAQPGVTSNFSKSVSDFSFAPLRPLDLEIRLDSGFSTYHSSISSPSLMSPQSPNPEESYRAQVGVATRVSRGTSITSGGGRKASIVTIVPASQVGGHQTTLPPVPALEESTTSGRRPRSSSGGAPTSGHGARTSLSGSESTSATPGNARRGSSVYAQNSVFQPSAGPPSRHTANLITLARRTAHISTVPGYGWRLHLLEKLEVIMGTYLTIHEAEEILCIGNGAEAKVSYMPERVSFDCVSFLTVSHI